MSTTQQKRETTTAATTVSCARWAWLVASALALTAPAAACDEPPPPDDDVGVLVVGLEAAGPAGSTYRLPVDATLHVASAGFVDDLGIGAVDAALYQASLPPGDYSWTLNGAGPGGVWLLQREDASGAISSVQAKLVNAQPGTFSISADATTSVTLQFDSTLGGIVTFAVGTLDVSMSVDETVATGVTADWTSSLTVSAAQAFQAAPAGLGDLLPGIGDGPFPSGFAIHVSGPWALVALDRVCAPATGDSLDVGGADNGWFSLFIESMYTTDVKLCTTSSGFTSVEWVREGPPTTSVFMGTGATLLRFEATYVFESPTPAFDGETLDVNLLAGSFQGTDGALSHEVHDLTTGVDHIWYVANYLGDYDLTVVPSAVP